MEQNVYHKTKAGSFDKFVTLLFLTKKNSAQFWFKKKRFNFEQLDVDYCQLQFKRKALTNKLESGSRLE